MQDRHGSQIKVLPFFMHFTILARMKPADDYGNKLLCGAIYALLGDGVIQARLAEANRHLVLLKYFADTIPREIWDDFSAIVNELTRDFDDEGQIPITRGLTPGQEMILTERLLSIYVAISGGNLIL